MPCTKTRQSLFPIPIYLQIGVVKNNKYSKMGFLTAVSPLVFTNKKKLDHYKSVSENCEKEVGWNIFFYREKRMACNVWAKTFWATLWFKFKSFICVTAKLNRPSALDLVLNLFVN